MTLVAALAALALWIVLGFLFPVGVGAIHLLFAVGATLLVRWYAIRHA